MYLLKKPIPLVSIFSLVVIPLFLMFFFGIGQSEIVVTNSHVNISDVTVLNVIGSSLLVGTSGHGIFEVFPVTQQIYSLNTGLDHHYPISYSSINTVAQDVLSGDRLYTGLNHSYILTSSNRGATWSFLSTIPSTNEIVSLAVDPGNNTRLFAGTDKGLFASTDSGATWHIVGNGLWRIPVNCVAIDPSNSQNIYAGTWYFNKRDVGRVYYSRDGGSTWSFTEMPCPIDRILIDPLDSGTIFTLNSTIGQSRGNCPLISTDYGQSFAYFDPDLVNRFVYDVAIGSSGDYAATGDTQCTFNQAICNCFFECMNVRVLPHPGGGAVPPFKTKRWTFKLDGKCTIQPTFQKNCQTQFNYENTIYNK